MLPNTALAEARPRRSALSSTTSSCSSVAVWMNSTQAARRRVPGPRVAAQPGGGQGEQRAQPLAAGGDDVRGKLRDERDGAVHPRHDRAVADRDILLDQRGENVQSILVAATPGLIRGSDAAGRANLGVNAGGAGLGCANRGQAGGDAQICLPACAACVGRHHIGGPETGSSRGGGTV